MRRFKEGQEGSHVSRSIGGRSLEQCKRHIECFFSSFREVMFSDFAQNPVAFFVVYSFLFSALFCPA